MESYDEFKEYLTYGLPNKSTYSMQMNQAQKNSISDFDLLKNLPNQQQSWQNYNQQVQQQIWPSQEQNSLGVERRYKIRNNYYCKPRLKFENWNSGSKRQELQLINLLDSGERQRKVEMSWWKKRIEQRQMSLVWAMISISNQKVMDRNANSNNLQQTQMQNREPIPDRHINRIDESSKTGAQDIILKGALYICKQNNSQNKLAEKNILQKKLKTNNQIQFQLELRKELQSGLKKEAKKVEIRYCNLLLICTKKGNKRRKVLDSREFNKGTEKVRYKFDSVQSVMNLMEPEMYATVLDLKSVYNRIKVDERLQPFISFQFLIKEYKYIWMQF
ncbi:MAG: hypothetical protein EZS28_016855 [Streblomastix strix]|uniref:Reverse transcriptase domain-containing protein n=1 Tax=Streblomastix strix TaxID=222440 RepID=A0A5J4VYA1_9EUKA|nr:MAG: hypothetical protein EZS28_016855 [Streblomastix strix]